MVAVMYIETIRLRTRKAKSKDIKFVASVLTNADVQRYTGGVKDSYKKTIDDIKRRPEMLNNFYLLETNNGDRIGYIAIVPNHELDTEEPLISILPEYWRKGYGKETLENLKKQWFSTKDEMLVTVDPRNTASIGLLKQLGFSFIKTIHDNLSQDHDVYCANKLT